MGFAERIVRGGARGLVWRVDALARDAPFAAVFGGEIARRGLVGVGLSGRAGLGHSAAAAVDGGGGAAQLLRVISGLDDVLELVEGEEAGLRGAEMSGGVGELFECGEMGFDGLGLRPGDEIGDGKVLVLGEEEDVAAGAEIGLQKVGLDG